MPAPKRRRISPGSNAQDATDVDGDEASADQPSQATKGPDDNPDVEKDADLQQVAKEDPEQSSPLPKPSMPSELTSKPLEDAGSNPLASSEEERKLAANAHLDRSAHCIKETSEIHAGKAERTVGSAVENAGLHVGSGSSSAAGAGVGAQTNSSTSSLAKATGLEPGANSETASETRTNISDGKSQTQVGKSAKGAVSSEPDSLNPKRKRKHTGNSGGSTPFVGRRDLEYLERLTWRVLAVLQTFGSCTLPEIAKHLSPVDPKAVAEVLDVLYATPLVSIISTKSNTKTGSNSEERKPKKSIRYQYSQGNQKLPRAVNLATIQQMYFNDMRRTILRGERLSLLQSTIALVKKAEADGFLQELKADIGSDDASASSSIEQGQVSTEALIKRLLKNVET